MKREKVLLRRSATLLFVALAVALSIGLYVVKHGVIELENRLTQINREIARDQKAIHVLRAEWSYLNEPSRLRDLAERHLGMSPAGGGQFGTLIALPVLAPAPSVAVAVPAMAGPETKPAAVPPAEIER